MLDVAFLQTTLDDLRVPLWSLRVPSGRGFFLAALLCALADRMPPRR